MLSGVGSRKRGADEYRANPAEFRAAMSIVASTIDVKWPGRGPTKIRCWSSCQHQLGLLSITLVTEAVCIGIIFRHIVDIGWKRRKAYGSNNPHLSSFA